MTLPEHAGQLVAEWLAHYKTPPRDCAQSLAEYILTQLADSESDYAGLLEEICQRRWAAEQVRAS